MSLIGRPGRPWLCLFSTHFHSLTFPPPLPSPEQLDKASSYEERSELRRAIRKLKAGGGQDSKKKVGSSNYRRAGYQAHITMSIPNSVTGNVLPNKVSTSNITKVEVPQAKATISYLKSSRQSTKKPSESSTGRSPHGSVSSGTSEVEINGRKVRSEVGKVLYSLC